MYWNEKIELLKKRFPPQEFKDPFRAGKEVVEKIVRQLLHSTPQHFFEADDQMSLLADWQPIGTCHLRQFYDEWMDRLPASTSYWLLVFVDRHWHVYDCQKDALRELLSLSFGAEQHRFYIADKKYRWGLYCQADREADHVEIFKSGGVPTPLN